MSYHVRLKKAAPLKDPLLPMYRGAKIKLDFFQPALFYIISYHLISHQHIKKATRPQGIEAAFGSDFLACSTLRGIIAHLVFELDTPQLAGGVVHSILLGAVFVTVGGNAE
jgi:hypothetical protein